MSAQPSLDYESFQTLLASAYEIQQTGIDAQSLASLRELRQLITTGEPGVDRAMQLIADRARNVANATGVAIALLNADQLVYRAGSGSAACYVGRRATAVLSVSSRNEARSEILRVENAQTDARIEAAICRQFGVNALLIIPVYQKGVIAGVMEVFFTEAHAFGDQEMGVYRLMARLIEETIFRYLQLSQKKALAIQSVRQLSEPIPSQIGKQSPLDRLHRAAATAHAAESAPITAPATTTAPLKSPLFESLRWNLAAAAVIAALVIATWMVQRSISPVNSPRSQSNAAAPKAVSVGFKQLPRKHAQSALAGVERQKTLRPSAFKLVRAGENEVDYISDDVTIRRFTSSPAADQVHGGKKKRRNIGKDVTVWYFDSKASLVPQIRPISTEAKSAESSTSVSK